MPSDHRLKIIAFIVAAAIIAVFSFGPIAQDPDYHRFADQRSIYDLPNFLNVFSNVPFLIIGMMGMRLIVLDEAVGGLAELKWLYFIFYFGVFLTGIGSSYYHYHPDNLTLVWDRLPMTISFMAFFCIIVGEYISSRWALKMSFPLLSIGLISVIYWYVTESSGRGDLRLYGLVQFLPIVLIPFILAFYSSATNGNRYIWGMIAVYAASKIMEFFDAGIYSATGFISGHSLKHLFAAAGPLILYWPLRYRKGGLGSGGENPGS